jgi:hypothetical protein
MDLILQSSNPCVPASGIVFSALTLKTKHPLQRHVAGRDPAWINTLQ